jgi:hypothetical protein
MEGVERGSVKKLLVVEELPKPVSFSATQEPTLGQHNLERTLGTVPVEPDGSAHFEAPANRSLVFLALDENDRCIKPMRSFVTLMPGEVTGCVGCHEERTYAPLDAKQLALDALKRPPSRIRPLDLTPRNIIDWPRDIQPILDANCIKCHSAQKRKGGVVLTGDRGQLTTLSYESLRRRYKQGGSQGMVPPYSAGSGDDSLLKFFTGGHHDVKANPTQIRLIKLWLDTGGTWAGTYAAVASGQLGAGFSANQGYYNPTDPKVLAQEIDLLQRRCDSCHNGQKHRARRYDKKNNLYKQSWGFSFPGRVLSREHTNLSRPELSNVLLAPLAKEAGGLGLCKPKGKPDARAVFAGRDDKDFQELREIVLRLSGVMEEKTWYHMDNFLPNPHYVREMKRYGVLDPAWEMGDPIDPFAVDDRYFKLFWHEPRKKW